MQEQIIETKKCRTCNSNFDIYKKDMELLDKLSPVFLWEKFNFPIPLECPICRRQKRLAWRNSHNLYRRKCDFSWKDILAFYNDEVKHPVYDIDIWESDVWNAMDYGQDFDFSRNFFEQFEELNNKVPHFSRSILNFENSDFCNNAANLKNCYLCFNGWEAEDSYYSITFKNIKNCVDCLWINDSEHCYESIDLETCSKVFFSKNCNSCYSSYFLKNCSNCNNCFWSKNLVNKEYCIFNKQYSKEQYKLELSKLFKENDIEQLKLITKEFFKKLPEKYSHWVNKENSSWDYINDSKDVFSWYWIRWWENIRYCTNINTNSKNLIDVDIFWWWLHNSYNSVIIWHNVNRIFCSFECLDNLDNIFYCIMTIRNSKNCFWCVWLIWKEYCIFNKQYTKEEYEELVPKIIKHMQDTGEWWNFFPPTLSSYWYNQTEWNVYEIMDKEEALKKWFKWSNYQKPFPKVSKIIPADKLPKDIKDIPDDILNWAIECEVTKKPFRIIKQELEFYRKHNLPVPKRHPDQRHLDRMALRNPRKLYDRKCDKCSVDMKTTYSPDREEIVYCGECYDREVY